MKFQTKLTILLHKYYFDKGFGLSNYLKYPIAFFALSSMNVFWTMVLAIIWIIFCYILGYYFVKYDWIKAEIEIQNRFNLFVEEVRKKLKKNNSLD